MGSKHSKSCCQKSQIDDQPKQYVLWLLSDNGDPYFYKMFRQSGLTDKQWNVISTGPVDMIYTLQYYPQVGNFELKWIYDILKDASFDDIINLDVDPSKDTLVRSQRMISMH